MKVYFLTFLVLFTHFATVHTAAAAGKYAEASSMPINGDGRGGGDLVFCRDQSDISHYSGLYTLDYLLTREDDFAENTNEFFRFSNNSKGSLDIINTIISKLDEASPQAARSLRSFIQMVENRDWSVSVDDDLLVRVWEPKARLLDYKDEDFISDLPANCYGANGKLDISQVILREDINSNILYHYNRNLFNQLKASPLQMSYLLIHEWLRDYTVQAASIRRVTQYLHSQEFFDHQGYEAYSAIRRMGIYFDRDASKEPVVQLMSFDTGVGCNGNCGFLDVSIKVKNVQYHKNVTIYYSENGGPWSEVAASYSRPLSYGYEEWTVQQNFSKSGHSIEFAVKYEVAGQIYWDNNRGKNYNGVFRYISIKPN